MATDSKPTATAEAPVVHTGPIHDTPNEAMALATVPKQTDIGAELHGTQPAHPAGPVAALVQFSPREIEIIKQTYMPGATDDELSVFVKVCIMRQLNPFTRQIYAIKRRQKRDGKWVDVWQHQSSIDAFRLIAKRTGRYRGQLVPLFCGPDGVYTDTWLQSGFPAAAKVGVLHADYDGPIFAVALWSEYVQTYDDGGPTAMWKKMPTVMLAKVAEALALRKAFPEELSGLYTDDEMAQADRGEREARQEAAANGSGAGSGHRYPEKVERVDPYAKYSADEELTLAIAETVPLFGDATRWGGHGGKPLGEVPTKVLQQVADWIRKKMDAKDMKPEQEHSWKLIRAAALLIVLHRPAEAQGDLPLTSKPITKADVAASGGLLDESDQMPAERAAEPKPLVNPLADLEHAHTGQLQAALREAMDAPFMPKNARAYFQSRLVGGKYKTDLAYRVAIAMARLCVEIGQELTSLDDERTTKEVDVLLLQPVTYKTDALTELRDRLRKRVA